MKQSSITSLEFGHSAFGQFIIHVPVQQADSSEKIAKKVAEKEGFLFANGVFGQGSIEFKIMAAAREHDKKTKKGRELAISSIRPSRHLRKNHKQPSTLILQHIVIPLV